MAQPSTLDAELVSLQVDVRCFNALQRVTNAQERMIMAQVYFWWTTAVAIPGYLEACYQKHNIVANKTKGVNFRPVLRLVSENLIQSNDLDIWAMAMRRIHEEVQRNQAAYVNDPIASVCHFIKSNHGKVGLAGYHGGSTSDEDDDQAQAEELRLFDLDEAALVAVLRDEARGFYAGNQHRPTINTPALHTSDEGYSVVVMHKQSGGVTLVGTSNDSSLIDQALVKTYRDDFTAQPLTVRSILEPLHVLNVPKAAAHAYDKLTERSQVRDPYALRPTAVQSLRRLVFRPETGDFLLSYTAVEASPVLRSRPHTAVIDRVSGDVFLLDSARRSVETRLLHQSAVNLFKASAEDKFHETQAGAIAANYLRLQTKVPVLDAEDISAQAVLAVTKNLNHPPLSFMPFYHAMGVPLHQVVFDAQRFEALWQAEVDLDWLRDLATQFTQKWIAARADKANRVLNKTMQLGFDKQSLIIGFDLDTTVGYSQTRILALPVTLTQGFFVAALRSVDLMFVLRQIADLNIIGTVTLRADKHALVFVFATDANSFECWIPTTDDKGQRDNTHFSRYDPTLSEGFEPELDLDDMVPEPTQQEDAQLLANMQRLRDRG